ncbi:ABC transporter ATP-binding protein [Lacticaseibacillus hegangensis]|uniref:ABC transporter ATP-binding protein n=1 Tax=Lacticaseibacillus hegangensis TaxID=2486010 RepID=A0ABW4CVH0_9LACO|nr:ABC transporter ATP-binding protein [Lacticaseibacillus hegangensis]
MAKKKPQYSLVNNLRWYFRQVQRYFPGLKWDILGTVVVTALTGVIGVIVPAWLVGLLASRAHFSYFVEVALGMAVALAAAGAASTFLKFYADAWGSNLRAKLAVALHQLTYQMPYQQLQTPHVQEQFHQSFSNALSWTLAGAEAIFRSTKGLLADGVTLLIFTATLSAFTPWLFVLVLVAAVIGYWGLQSYRQWYETNKANWATQRRQTSYLGRTAYALENGKDMRLYHIGDWYQSHYEALLQARMHWQRADSTRTAVAELIGDVAGFVRDGAAYTMLVLAAAAQTLSIAQFTLLFGVTNQFVALTNGLLMDWHQLQKASLDLQELRAFTDHQTPAPTQPLAAADASQLAKRPVTIQFEHVSYLYPEAENPTLRDVSFTLAGGERLALVGVNGAGKSTLSKLMMGLLDPTSGTIRINGIDAATLPPQTRYALFAPVFQESTLIAADVAQNVAMTAEPDARRVQAALKQADLTQTVADLKQGVHTQLTRNLHDDGADLSGGQAQKLMLARALHKDAPVLILDEPTAALDAIAESAVYQMYATLTTGKTSLFISHRLASTRFCDQIIFLADGRIAEQGTHEELLNAHGRYAEMYAIQSKYYQKEVKQDGSGQVVLG